MLTVADMQPGDIVEFMSDDQVAEICSLALNISKALGEHPLVIANNHILPLFGLDAVSAQEAKKKCQLYMLERQREIPWIIPELSP